MVERIPLKNKKNRENHFGTKNCPILERAPTTHEPGVAVKLIVLSPWDGSHSCSTRAISLSLVGEPACTGKG
jgi:hypothetical protein